VRTPEFGKREGRTADPSASLGMTILFGNTKYSFQDELSSRPERTRMSCHAALDKTACAPFCKGKAHEVHQRHQVPQEIRGSVAEGSAVRPSGFPNSGPKVDSFHEDSKASTLSAPFGTTKVVP
jgi:hypothetical protein